jgi:hypothetical protein
VIRGARMTGRVELVMPPPGITIIRGGRPRAADLGRQSGPLIIRIQR